jgi:acyl-CoA synthetase (AMP-forming)/AMP-acid ligase II
MKSLAERLEALRTDCESVLRGHTLPTVFDAAVRDRGDEIAVLDRGRSYTWRQWRDDADAVAYGLQGLGIEPGEVVAVQLPNCMDFLTLHVAVAKIGAILLPVHPDCGDRQLSSLIRNSGAAALVVPDAWRDEEGSSRGKRAQAETTTLRQVLLGGAGQSADGSVSALIAQHAGARPKPGHIRPERPLLLIASSGTSSAYPKICVHTHDGLLSNAEQVVADSDSGAQPGSDLMLSASPFTFLFGLLSVHVSLVTQAAQTLLPRSDVEEFLDTAIRHRPTLIFAVPAQLHDAVARAGTADPPLGLTPARQVRTGGVAVSPGLVTSVKQWLADEVIVQWGMSEVGAGTFTRPGDRVDATGHAIGRPISGGRVRIVAPDGTQCPEGVEGELQYRSPYAFLGYWLEQELTAAAVTEDGWLRTGDLASVDAGGALRFHGRALETINIGGSKVNAIEIEELLADLVPLSAAAVVGRPDDRLGEIACAVCVVKEGESVTLDEIVRHLNGKGVAWRKVPTEIMVVDRLPHTPNGKLARRQLADLVAGNADAGRAGSARPRGLQ